MKQSYEDTLKEEYKRQESLHKLLNDQIRQKRIELARLEKTQEESFKRLMDVKTRVGWIGRRVLEEY